MPFCALNTQLLTFAPVLHIIYGVIDLIGISLCMIVKNEERVLARCLNSALRAVDEIITVDTGSTDKTKEIAARYSDKVFDFEWCDDFRRRVILRFQKPNVIIFCGLMRMMFCCRPILKS